VRVKKVLATATAACALGLGALGARGAVAGADPVPWKPGDGNDDNGPSWQDNDWQGDNWQGDWNVGGRDWWRGRPDKWWRDGDLPPWGYWGKPPPVRWSGPPPWENPRQINYWGYDATPVWDDSFHGWGIWLFGIWIPIIGIGVF
jgi:hypothetical protein